MADRPPAPGRVAGDPGEVMVEIADTGTGMTMAVTLLAALRKSEKTGEGCRLQVAMQDAMVNYCRIAYASQLLHKKPCPRMGNQVVLGTNAPSDVFKCKPGGPND